MINKIKLMLLANISVWTLALILIINNHLSISITEIPGQHIILGGIN